MTSDGEERERMRKFGCNVTVEVSSQICWVLGDGDGGIGGRGSLARSVEGLIWEEGHDINCEDWAGGGEAVNF